MNTLAFMFGAPGFARPHYKVAPESRLAANCRGVHGTCAASPSSPYRQIEAASHDQPVAVDVYPYIAGSTNLRMDLVTTDYRIMIAWSTPHPEMGGRDLPEGVSLHQSGARNARIHRDLERQSCYYSGVGHGHAVLVDLCQ